MLMEANRSKKNTIQQVAEAAGVSIATASRAINQPESVKESTRLKVISAARKLNYRSTPKASRNILVIISSLWNPFHTEMINGIEEAAKKRGYFVYINQSGMWTAQEKIDNLLDSTQFSGIIYTHASIPEEYLQALQVKYPVVFCSQVKHSAIDVPYVTVDDYGATVRAIKYLLSTSRRRIAFVNMTVSNNSKDSFQYRRQKAYIDTIEKAFGECDRNLICNISDEIDFDIAVPKLRSFIEKNRPDALFCVSDIYACAAIKAAATLGIEIPKDLAVMGFDNISLCLMMTPTISTVSQPIYQMGMQSCNLIIDMIEGRPIVDRHIILNTELVIREST